MDKEAFLQPTNELELHATYVVERSRLGARLQVLRNESTRVESHLLEGTSDGNKLTYFVAFYSDTAEPILDQDLQRWLCDNKRLKGNPSTRSKVAYRVRFAIRGQFQREGLAKEIFPKEEDFFRHWGAREVQTDAMDMGRWAWTRSRFGYKSDQFFFETLQQQYRDWQRSKGSAVIVRANNLSNFPREFLLSNEVSSLPLFKEL